MSPLGTNIDVISGRMYLHIHVGIYLYIILAKLQAQSKTMKNVVFSICFFFLACSLSGQEQQEMRNNYSKEAFLTDSRLRVEMVYKDREGYLWIFSDNRSFRYDGNELLDTRNLFKASSLSPDIDLILEDKSGTKYFIQKETDGFQLMELGEIALKSITLPDGHTIKDVKLDDGGDVLFIASIKGNTLYLLSFDIQTGKFKTPSSIKVIKRPNQPVSIGLSDGTFYFATHDYFVKYDGTHITNELSLPESNNRRLNPSTQSLMKSKNGDFLFSLGHSADLFYTLSAENYSQIHQIKGEKDSDVFTGLYKDGVGNILATWNSLDGFYKKMLLLPKGNIKEGRKVINEELGTVTSIIGSDFEKEITISGFAGLHHIYFYDKTFKQYLSKRIANNVNYLNEGISIRGILDTDNGLYIAREINNLYKVLEDGEVEEIYVVEEGDTIYLRCLNNVLQYKDEIWLSSCSDENIDRLICYNTRTGKAKWFKSPGRIKSIFLDSSDNRVYYGLNLRDRYSGLGYFDIEKKSFFEYKVPSITQNILPITFLYKSSDTLYVGSGKGLYSFKVDKKEATSIETHLSAYHSQHQITSINHIDNEYVVSTLDEGAFFHKDGVVVNVNQTSGLLSNAVCGILKDYNGSYWLSTYNGLYVVNTEKILSHAYFEPAGINHNEFNRYAFHGQDSTLYFGGVNGVLEIDLARHYADEDSPLVDSPSISKLSFYNNSLKTNETVYLNGRPKIIDINQNQENCVISFLDLHERSEKSLMRVKIAERNMPWVVLSNDHNFTIPDLGWGDYTLEVERKSEGLDWVKVPELSIPIRSRIPIQETPLFKFILTLILFGLTGLWLFSIYKRRLQLQEMRADIAADLHDNLGSMLSAIGSKAEIAALKNPNNHESYDAIVKDSQEALELMRDTIWSVNPEHDTLGNIADRMRDYAFNTLNHLGVKVKYDFNIEEDKKVGPLWKRDFYLIFKEAITNILKHSEARSVSIVLHQEKCKVKLDITNDGVLKSTPSEGLGMGLRTMRKRAKNLNGSFAVNQADDQFKIYSSFNLS